MSEEEAAAHRAPGTIVQTTATGERRGRSRTLPSRHSRSGASFCAAKAKSFVIVQRGARRLPDHFRLAVFFGAFFERKSRKRRGLKPVEARHKGVRSAGGGFGPRGVERRYLVQVGACNHFSLYFWLAPKVPKSRRAAILVKKQGGFAPRETKPPSVSRTDYSSAPSGSATKIRPQYSQMMIFLP